MLAESNPSDEERIVEMTVKRISRKN